MVDSALPGTLKYLVADSGTKDAGLYYFDGQAYQRLVNTNEVNTGVTPINLVAGSHIQFTWNSATSTLTISYV